MVEPKVAKRFLDLFHQPTDDYSLAGDLILKQMNQSELIRFDDFDVYLKGKAHIFVANDITQEYKIFFSELSKERKMEKQKRAS